MSAAVTNWSWLVERRRPRSVRPKLCTESRRGLTAGAGTPLYGVGRAFELGGGETWVIIVPPVPSRAEGAFKGALNRARLAVKSCPSKQHTGVSALRSPGGQVPSRH